MRIYQRTGSPYWQYDFAWNGQRYRGSSGCKSQREAEIHAYTLLAEIKARPTHRQSWAITHVIATWWDEHARHTRSSDAIWSNIENLSRCLDCTIMLEDLLAPRLLDFRARRRGEGASGPTINRDLAYLKAAINHAVKLHGKTAPALNWKSLKYPESPWRVRFLSAEEYAALIAAAHADLRPIIIAAVATGLRRGNLREMQWHQVDLPGGTITVPRTKAGRPVTVRISAPLRTALVAIRRPKGDVFDWTNFKRRWIRAVADAGLQDFRFHDLRHTFASWARKGGADLISLRDALDHSSIDMTMRYAHIVSDQQQTPFDHASSAMQSAIDNAAEIGTETGTNGTIHGTIEKKKA